MRHSSPYGLSTTVFSPSSPLVGHGPTSFGPAPVGVPPPPLLGGKEAPLDCVFDDGCIQQANRRVFRIVEKKLKKG